MSKLLKTISGQTVTFESTNMITMYARHHASSGSNMQEKITFQAKHPSSYYKAYPYFSVHCSTSRYKLLPSRPTSSDPYTEWLIRARRCVLFSDTSGLRPMPNNTITKANLCNRLLPFANLDHSTIWKSAFGRTFLLNEPYVELEKSTESLNKAGFVFIEVPLNLSPYCGGALSQSSKPLTRSYLITKDANITELQKIESRLKEVARSAKTWNDSSDITCI